MIFRHSLRFRIIISFCLFGAVLATIYGVGVFISMDLIEDDLFNNRLELEIEHFLAQYQQNVKAPLPTSPYITAYIGTASMPPHIRQLVSGFTEGLHDLWQEDYHIAVQTLPHHDEPLYVIYNVRDLEIKQKRALKVGVVLIAGLVLVIGLGLWIGFLMSRKAIAPVVQLAELVNKAGPENLPTDLSKQFYDDEVGVLAQTLEHAMQRVEAFVDRERQFTRDASHELRTPVTVIKGAVELLQQLPANKERSVHRPLQRIERSVNDMESTIESLLWLAREEAAIDPGQTCDVLPVVRDVIEQHRHLFAEKPVEIDLVTEANPSLAAPAPVFQIAIANLVRNALHYTAEGKITVYIRDDRVEVFDTGMGIAADDLDTLMQPHVRGKDSRGFGIGLAIVKRLCDRFGWHLEIESEVERGTRVQLIFLPSQKSTVQIP